MFDWIIIGLLVIFILGILFWPRPDPYVRNVVRSRNSRNRRVDRELY